MRRVFTLLLAALLLAMPACAALAEAGQTFSNDYYTLTIPQDWVIDTSDLEKEEGFEELGNLYSPEIPGLVIEAGLIYYSDLSDLSLWNADEETMQGYIDTVLEELEEDRPQYRSTLKAGEIPFIIISAQSDDGPYCYIDTLTNGYAVVFYVYVAGTDDDTLLPMGDADWAQIEAILSTFKPAG